MARALGRDPNEYYLNRRFITLLLILTYIFLISALFVILTTPAASTFEFSFYDTYPSYFWLLLILSTFLGILSAILSLQNTTTQHLWVLGLLAEVVSISILLFLPMIRGYFIYGSGDVLTHIGYMLDIEKTGSFGSNHYPGFHIIGENIKLLSDLTYGTTTMMFLGILSLISILFWFILGKTIFKSQKAIVVLVLIAALPMLTSGLFTPNSLSNLLIPLLLFFSVKNIRGSKSELSLCFLLLGSSMVFFHPLVTTMTLLILTIMYFYNMIYNFFAQNCIFYSKLYRVIFTMAVIFSIWSSYIVMFLRVVKPLIDSLTGREEQASALEKHVDIISRMDLDFLYLAKLTMYTYGDVVIFSIFIFLCFILILHHIKRGLDLSENYFLYYSMICCTVFYIMSILIFVNISSFNITRITRLALLFSFIVAAYTISYLVDYELKWPIGVQRTVFFVYVLILLLILIYFVTFGFHLSPFTKKSHQQVTISNFVAAQHLFEKRNTSIPIIVHGLSFNRLNDANYGTRTSNHEFYNRDPNLIPDHYGYNESNLFGYYFGRDHYYILTDEFRGLYRTMIPEFPHLWKFTATDFKMLMSDVSVSKIYSNNFSDIFYIRGFRKT